MNYQVSADESSGGSINAKRPWVSSLTEKQDPQRATLAPRQHWLWNYLLFLNDLSTRYYS